jgi:hypothetical protein
MRPVLHASAGEHTHNYFWSFLHGAHASGLKQADVILRYRSTVANWPKLRLHIYKKKAAVKLSHILGKIYHCNFSQKEWKGRQTVQRFSL